MSSASASASGNGGGPALRGRRRDVVVVGGCRTPFLRSGTAFADVSSHHLCRAAVAGLLHRAPIDPDVVDLLVVGRVVPDPETTNVAREVVFGTDLPARCVGHTVTAACVSSLQAAADAVRAIAAGAAEVAIAAGTDTGSDAPLLFRRPVRERLIAAQRARGLAARVKLLRGLRPRDLLPQMVAVAERTTGETMGQNAERLAKRCGITREAQDRFALTSHQRAVRAAQAGWLGAQIVPVVAPPRFRYVTQDNGVRADTSAEKLAGLRPAFDQRFGTITAGNASFLSDGAAAVLLMAAERADELGVEPVARIAAIGTSGQEPWDDLLVGPALAAPRALEQAGVELDDIGVVEIHEAFAAQVLAVLGLMEDARFCRDALGRSRPVGAVDPERLNAWGGSLAVGHPFGATGARLIWSCAARMRAERAERGLVAACAGGALGLAMVLEAP